MTFIRLSVTAGDAHNSARQGHTIRKRLRTIGSEDLEIYSATGGMAMSTFAVVIERTETGFSAYVPDLPGCISTGGSISEVEERMRKGIELHLQAMREDGDTIPEPTTIVRQIEIA